MFAVESPVLADDSTLSDFALPNSQTKVAALNSCRPQLGWGRNPCCISKCVCIDTSKFMKQTEANANNQPNTCIHWSLLILSSNQSQVWVIGAVECVGRVRLVYSNNPSKVRPPVWRDTPYHAIPRLQPLNPALLVAVHLESSRFTTSTEVARPKEDKTGTKRWSGWNQAQAITQEISESHRINHVSNLNWIPAETHHKHS